MTTIGYGDVKPISLLGRSYTIIFAIIGVVLNSLLLISVINYLQMLSSESKAYFTEKILSEKEDIKKIAAKSLS